MLSMSFIRYLVFQYTVLVKDLINSAQKERNWSIFGHIFTYPVRVIRILSNFKFVFEKRYVFVLKDLFLT